LGVVKSMSEATCRAIVSERSKGLCEVRIEGVCRGVGESKHHRRKVSQGGQWLPSNIVDVCGHGTIGCHGHIEKNPATARRLGLWLYTGSLPTSTPVKLYFRGLTGWYLLHDDGSITWLSQQALSELKR
jgi:hypothetical protein